MNSYNVYKRLLMPETKFNYGSSAHVRVREILRSRIYQMKMRKE